MIDVYYRILTAIERDFGVRCLHNEFKIIALLHEHQYISYTDLLKLTGRSHAGHSLDLKSLHDAGLIIKTTPENDKRGILYSLSERTRAGIDFVLDKPCLQLGQRPDSQHTGW